MTLRVSGKNLDIGEALRTHVQARISAALGKYHAGPFEGHVTIEPEGSGFRADCTLHLNSGATLQADAEAHEPYASFNLAADRIERRVRRHRKRLSDHHASGTGNGQVSPEANVTPEPELPDYNAIDEAALHEENPAVIAEPSSRFKEMTVSNAVKELDVTNAQVVVFRHASDGRPNVVYRRPDGNIGWIDPGRL